MSRQEKLRNPRAEHEPQRLRVSRTVMRLAGALGPTLVLLKQEGPWSYGALANHIVDVGGGRRRVDISSTFLQPFVSRGIGQGRTVGVNLESTYDWEAKQWTLPLNVFYSKVAKLGSQMLSYQGGARVYMDTPSGGPDWGVRFTVTLLFPE